MARRGRPRHPDILTPREWEVLALLRERLTNEQIAERLSVTVHAVRYHVSEILSKLGVTTREEAAAWQPHAERRTGIWTRALEGAVVIGAIAAITAVAAVALGVFRTSSGDEGDQTAIVTQTASVPTSETPIPTASFVPSTPPSVGANVRDMQLVNEGFGWVLTDEALTPWSLLPTGYTGAIFPRNILPTEIPVSDVIGVQFLDSSNGWMASIPDRVSSEGFITTTSIVRIFRTTDGGGRWQSVDETDFGPNHYLGGAFFDFLDANTGWLVLKESTNTAHSVGLLYRTTDGGATWTQLSIPTGDPVYFTNSNDGWAAGGPQQATLYATHNGGGSWEQTPGLTALLPVNAIRRFGLPLQAEDGNLYLAAVDTQSSFDAATPDSSVIRLFASFDGGSTWSIQSSSAAVDGNLIANQVLPDGSVIGISTSPSRSQLLVYDPTTERWTQSDPASLDGAPFSINFIDIQRGWALVNQSGCRSFKSDCWSVNYVEWTEDGGQTWKPIVAFSASPTP